MDGCLADEGIAAVDILGTGVADLIFRWTTDDEGSIIDVLSSHSVRSGDMDRSTISRTPESLVGVVERATSVSVQTTAIAARPDWLSFHRGN